MAGGSFLLFDQRFGSVATGCAIQAEIFGFVVVAVLHSEGGEGTGSSRREMSWVDGGVLPRWCSQAHYQSIRLISVRRSRPEEVELYEQF